MATISEALLLTLRNQAEARLRGVEEPRLTISDAELVLALDAVEDARLVLAWVTADVTRSIVIDDSGEDPVLSLVEGVTEAHSIPLTETSVPAPSAVQRTALRAELA